MANYLGRFTSQH